jgi:hypothetical protein
MASAYPSGFDSLAKPTETTLEDDAGFEHDIVHTNEANAIEAVQTTLGLNPEGAFTTVDDRIADLEVLGKPVLSKVRNSTGATLTKGTAVYLSGATGNHVNVTKALATSDATSARTQGFVWESIANNADGYVIVEGYLENIDTSAAASDGQIVYLSGSVAGGWTVTKPVAPIHMVYLGVIAKKNPSTGAIYVKVQNGFELDEIHDVLVVSEANGDLLKYDSASGLWKNAAQSTLTVAQSQVTGLVTDLSGKVGTARTISTTAPLAGGGDLSADRTLTIADGTTSVKGAVQLTDSTSSTSTTTAATPNAVKSAYDLANGAVPKSTVTTTGDLIVANGASSVTRLAAGTAGQVLTANGAGVAPTYQTASGLALVDRTSWPVAGTGNNGDYCLVRDEAREGSNQMFLVGPKAAGAWPTYGYVISRGVTGKQTLSNGTLQGGSAINNATHYAYTNLAALPDTTNSGWESVSGLLADANGVYGTIGAGVGKKASLTKISGGTGYQPVSSFSFAKVTVGVLPASGGFIGCGSSGQFPYFAVTDYLGKIYLAATIYGGTAPVTATPMASGSNGDVRANDQIVYKKEGSLFTVLVIDGTTGAVRRTLNAVVGGASGYLIYNDATGRLKSGGAIA